MAPYGCPLDWLNKIRDTKTALPSTHQQAN
jgi:hypothetical protein